MNSTTLMHTAMLIATMAIVTALIRFLPFLVFAGGTPKPLEYLGKVLSYSIMAMLVVYCLKGIDFLKGQHGIPELLSVLLVVLLHKWKHNTLLSIVCGTVCYMLLLRML